VTTNARRDESDADADEPNVDDDDDEECDEECVNTSARARVY
jgi:hypothetical protein